MAKVTERPKKAKTPTKARKAELGLSKAAVAARELTFIEYYIANNENGTQAAIAAGYSEKCASVQASRMLNNHKIQAELKRRREELQVKHGLTTDRLLKELANIVYADLRKFYGENGELLSPKDWPDEIASAVAGVEVTEISGTAFKTNKLRLWDKNAAIEKAMKHLGLFKADNSQLGEAVRACIVPAKQPKPD